MTTWELLTSTWTWKPSVVAGCAVLLIAYGAALRFRFPKVAGFFVAGVLVLLLALVSPIATLAGTLFAAHMLQYFLLAMIAPPLMLLGIPRELMEKALAPASVATVERVLGRPTVGWILGIGVMAAWHIPALHAAAMGSQGLHIIQNLTFLVSASIFWWPVYSPLEQRRLSPLLVVLYLSTACMFCSVTGIIITFAPLGIYPDSIHPGGPLNVLLLIRNGWGLSAQADQQLAGLLMWIPGCLVYVSGMLITLGRWYLTPERPGMLSATLGREISR
jgi:putative membrane protein